MIISNDNEKLNIKIIVLSYDEQIQTLQNEEKLGIFDSGGLSSEIEMIKEKKRKLKTETVLSMHITNSGEIRAIYQYEHNGIVLWRTKLANKKIVTAKTYDGLIDKLFDIYICDTSDFDIQTVFTKALEEKASCENPKQATINKYRTVFKRFFNKEFLSKDVRKIDKVYIQQYTQNLVNNNPIKEKALKEYKSILILIFKYALSKGLISSNPIDSINFNVFMKSCTVSMVPIEERKILSKDEIECIKKEFESLKQSNFYKGYCYNAYVALLAIETGMRAGELCALSWNDIDYDNKRIHIHSQMLENKQKGLETTYYVVDYTKNERGVSKGGRYFPLTDSISSILDELKSIYKKMNIHSEYVFVKEDGSWVTTGGYESFIHKVCKRLGFKVTNNHAFRMSLNSNVFIPLGIPETERAKLLGHSVETNLKHYSFAEKDYINKALNILNDVNNINDI